MEKYNERFRPIWLVVYLHHYHRDNLHGIVRSDHIQEQSTWRMVDVPCLGSQSHWPLVHYQSLQPQCPSGWSHLRRDRDGDILRNIGLACGKELAPNAIRCNRMVYRRRLHLQMVRRKITP